MVAARSVGQGELDGVWCCTNNIYTSALFSGARQDATYSCTATSREKKQTMWNIFFTEGTREMDDFVLLSLVCHTSDNRWMDGWVVGMIWVSELVVAAS